VPHGDVGEWDEEEKRSRMIVRDREKMNSIERMGAVLAGEKPDRVPFIPFASGFNALVAGYEIRDHYSDPEKSFRAQLLCKEILGHDGHPLFSYASFGAWEFGGKIRFPQGEYEQAPVVLENPGDSAEKAEGLRVPKVETAGYMPRAIAFSRMAAARGFPIAVKLGTPFTTAGTVIGEELMMRWIMKRPDLVHLVLRKVTDFFIDIAHFFSKEYGAEKILAFEGAPTEANNLISPKQFEEFALPYLIESHEKMLDMGIKRFLSHICGEQNLNLRHWQKVPMGEGGVVSFGTEVDLERAIELFGENRVIAGNVDPNILIGGSPEEVYDHTRETLLKGKKAPRGYILMPGCELPPRTPLANVYYLRKALNDFGFYGP